MNGGRPPPAGKVALPRYAGRLAERFSAAEVERYSVLESDGVSPVAIIGIHQLDAVGKLARLCGRLDVAMFIGSGVYGHASIMLDLGSKPLSDTLQASSNQIEQRCEVNQ